MLREVRLLPVAWQHVFIILTLLSIVKKIFNALELCSGPGGLSTGFMLARYLKYGFFVAVANDADKNVSQTYMANNPDTEFVLGSLSSEKIKKIIQDKLIYAVGTRGTDIVIGGPPCQGFSNANRKTRIMANPLNRLVFDFVEMVRRVRPFSFVMENVPGITSIQDGKMIERIIRDFQSMGYANSEYWILNAANYEVPQNRKRVFVVGSKSPDKIVRPTQTRRNNSTKQHISAWEALSDLPAIPPGSTAHGSLGYRRGAQNNFQKKLRNGSNTVKNHIVTINGNEVIERFRCVPQGGNWKDIPKRKMSLKGTYKNTEDTHSGIYRRLAAAKPSVTITNFRKSMLIHPTQNRLLSVREAARLQTFRDSFEFHGPLHSMQQQVSDAVPVNLAAAVAKSMLKHMVSSLQTIGVRPS